MPGKEGAEPNHYSSGRRVTGINTLLGLHDTEAANSAYQSNIWYAKALGKNRADLFGGCNLYPTVSHSYTL